MLTQKEVLKNYDEANIASVERLIVPKSQNKKAFTMLQGNTECDVEVTDGSMEKCADILFS